MERDEDSLAYIQLVEYVAEDLEKTDRWVKRVLKRDYNSMVKFFAWFNHNRKHSSTEEIRSKREELLMNCPVDLLPTAMNKTRVDVGQPNPWEALLYTKTERRLRACACGEEIDVEGLEFLEIARCAIVKMTCQNVLPV